MNTLTVSVVIPTYNRADLLPRAIDSALANIREGDEIIVADDASTDNTAEVVRRYGDRIRYLQCAHGGGGAARNRGIEAATKDLVAFLDSDDEWHADKLQIQRTLMERRPDILYAFSDFGVRDGGAIFPRYLINWHHDERSWDEILAPGVNFSSLAPLPVGRADFRVHIGDLYAGELERDYVLTSSFIARRSVGDALHFAEDVASMEDWECFGRVLRLGLGAYIDCETTWQIGHSGPRISLANEMKKNDGRLAVMQRVWGADPAFLAKHGDLYRRMKAKYHLERAKCRIHQGNTRGAREDLREAGSSPMSYRLLASLPGTVAKALLKARRILRRPIAENAAP